MRPENSGVVSDLKHDVGGSSGEKYIDVSGGSVGRDGTVGGAGGGGRDLTVYYATPRRGTRRWTPLEKYLLLLSVFLLLACLSLLTLELVEKLTASDGK